MRTAIFFGLVLIAESIGKQTGWKLEGPVIIVGVLVFILASMTDFAELFKFLFWKG